MDDIEASVREEIAARVNKYIEDFISAELLELAREETRKFMEAAGIFAEQNACLLEESIGAIMNAVNGGVNPKQVRRAFSDLTTAWDRKEAREKLRAAERETTSRFRQHKAGESAWAARKRTRPRQREWRGPWRGEKN